MARLHPKRTLEQILKDIPVASLDSMEAKRQLCQYIGYNANPDLRNQVWNLSIDDGQPLTIRGCVSSKFALRCLEKAFETFGVACGTGAVTVLPGPDIGEQRTGLVVCTECPIHEYPDSGEQFDTALYGSSVYLLLRNDTHSLVHSENGYVGWVNNLHYRRIHQDEWIEWTKLPRAIFVGPWSEHGIEISPGAELPILPSKEVILPTGSKLPVSDKHQNYVIPQNNEQRKALLVVGRSLLGTPYVWGGVSPKGIDCSGFLRYVYRSIGFLLPRDADQQFLCGRIVGLPGMMGAIHAGDLLFFANDFGRIGHVAMAVDEECFIHADGKQGVTVARWDHEPKRLDTFVVAKRIIR